MDRKYIAHHLQIQNRMASLFKAKIYHALQAQIKPAVSDLRHYGAQGALDRLHKHDFNAIIGPVLMNLYKTAGLAIANRTAAYLNKYLGVNKSGQLVEMTLKYRTLGHNAKWTAEIQEYFRKYLLDKSVKPISDTTKKFIESRLSEGIDKGWGVDRIATEIESSDITKHRASLIVRTETTRAANYGGMAAAYNNEYETEKEWNEVIDLRTRLSHRHGTGVGGEKIDLLDRFSNGLLFPGDPDGDAAEVCNCRCVLTYSPKRDANGRLIPKTKVHAPAANTIGGETVNNEPMVEHLTAPSLAEILSRMAIHNKIFETAKKIIEDNLN